MLALNLQYLTFVDEREYTGKVYQTDNDLTITVIILISADYFVPLTGLHYNIYIYIHKHDISSEVQFNYDKEGYERCRPCLEWFII